MRKRALGLLAAALLALALGGWRIGGHIVNITTATGGAIDYITSTFTSTAANNGWVAASATDCPFYVSGTAQPGSATVTAINTTGLHTGDVIYDGNNNQYFPWGTTITQIQTPSTGGQSNGAITLSNPSLVGSTTTVGFYDNPQYPVTQVDWDPAKTTDQPQNALATGGIASASLTTGSPTITGVNNIFGASAGWWVTSDAMNAPAQIQSVSGSGPYTITLADSGAEVIATTSSSQVYPITIQPNEPTILQYRVPGTQPDGSAGPAAAASFTGYIDNGGGQAGLVLHVTAIASGSIALYVPLYAPGGGLAQGTYVTGCPAGGCGGVGDYTVSDSQLLGSSGSPVSLDAMGLQKTWRYFYGQYLTPGPFPRAATTPTYENNDVFTVLPAIYSGDYQVLPLAPQLDSPGGCTQALVTAGQPYVSCSGTALNGLAVGDYVDDGTGTAELAGYITGTTMVVLNVAGAGQYITPTVGELVTGAGVAANTVITGCPGGSCGGTGLYTVGCATGASGACASQTVGAETAPVALDAAPNWPSDQTNTVVQVWTSGQPAGCPGPTTDLCFQVSRNAIVSKAASDNWNVATVRPMNDLTIEGITENVGGTPTRPALSEDGGFDGGQVISSSGSGVLDLGGFGMNTNFLMRNIDLESDGLFGKPQLITLTTGIAGTTTLAQMRIEGQLWAIYSGEGNEGDGLLGGFVYPVESDEYADPSAVDPVDEVSGTFNFIEDEFDWNGSTDQRHHNIYIGDYPNLTVNFINDWSHDVALGHLLKIRAGTANITGSYLEDGDALSGINGVAFNGSIAGNILTANTPSKGKILPDETLSGSGIAAGTVIYGFVPGSGTPGGAGQYYVGCSDKNIRSPDCAQTAASTAITANYIYNGTWVGPISNASVNAEFPCGGDDTIKNTIMTKGFGGMNAGPVYVQYNAEGAGYSARVTTSAATPFGGTVLNFGSTLSPDFPYVGDSTNPNAFGWELQQGISGSTITFGAGNSGAAFTASISVTTLDVTAGTGPTGTNQALSDSGGTITPGTVVTGCPAAGCGQLGDYTINNSQTVASEAMISNCGGGVCMTVPQGETIWMRGNCPWGSKANNRLIVQNDDFVAYHADYDGAAGYSPFLVRGGTNNYGQLPGDTDWPFEANSDWLIDDDLFAGICSSATQVVTGKDTTGITANQSLAFGDWPWTGPPANGGSGLPAHVELVLSPAELSESYQQIGTQYGDSADSGVVGVLAYAHAAAAGIARSLMIIGAEEASRTDEGGLMFDFSNPDNAAALGVTKP